MPNTDFYFVTHSRKDHVRVQPIIEELQAAGIALWLDTMLTPGESWHYTIMEALTRTKGWLIFLSQTSLTMPAIQMELEAIEEGGREHIVAVQLDPALVPPPELRGLTLLDISQDNSHTAATKIASALLALPPVMDTCFDSDQNHMIAQAIAAAARTGSKNAPPTSKAVPDSIFIVHGHDLALRDQVENYLSSLGIKSIILSAIEGGRNSLFQKFLTFSEDVEFAVVLITADDYGASRRQYDAPNVGEKALQFRARQNVILELGFFYGYLGWENVFILYQPPTEVFPNFEVPSDLGGILFDEVDTEGRWQNKLWRRLEAAGFPPPKNL